MTQVHEWRIERTLDAGGFVLSIIAPGGESQSFLVAAGDAQDIGEVLRRSAAWSDRHEPPTDASPRLTGPAGA